MQNADPPAYGRARAHTHADTHADADAHADPCAYERVHAHADAQTDADADAHAHADHTCVATCARIRARPCMRKGTRNCI